jgi:hypothetical protein
MPGTWGVQLSFGGKEARHRQENPPSDEAKAQGFSLAYAMTYQ